MNKKIKIRLIIIGLAIIIGITIISIIVHMIKKSEMNPENAKTIVSNLNNNDSLSGSASVDSIANGGITITLIESDEDNATDVAHDGLSDAILVAKQINQKLPVFKRYYFKVDTETGIIISTFNINYDAFKDFKGISSEKIKSIHSCNYAFNNSETFNNSMTISNIKGDVSSNSSFNGTISNINLAKGDCIITLSETAESTEKENVKDGLADAISIIKAKKKNTIVKYNYIIENSNNIKTATFTINSKLFKNLTVEKIQKDNECAYKFYNIKPIVPPAPVISTSDINNIISLKNNMVIYNNLICSPTNVVVNATVCSMTLPEIIANTSEEAANAGLKDGILLAQQITKTYPSLNIYKFVVTDLNGQTVATFEINLTDINDISTLTTNGLKNLDSSNYTFTDDKNLDENAPSDSDDNMYGIPNDIADNPSLSWGPSTHTPYAASDIGNTIDSIPVGDFENVVNLGQGTYEVNLGVIEGDINDNTEDALDDAVSILQATIPQYPNIKCYVFQAFDSNNNKIVFFDVKPKNISDLDDLTGTQLMNLQGSNFWTAPSDY